ncbi:MAG: bifunctional methylenetetrahydrofolate dehydrogenase/methenyltetrahydrofolate cyclohydrolase FolD [Actinobacteria bacterium HGW-Actinobacteria-7]|nr:MAG: bifunctional methylenetetrahydrofolate dehydrogenase/methenyltetrahydrofolate cyclohydrolase FolD [Actinobacteria bacterium HGW-Actinobacteria-7]
MAATIIDGKAISAKRRARIAERVTELKARGISPGLAVVIVGEDPASQVYVRNKVKACEETGVFSAKIVLPAETTQEALLAVVEELNGREDINGILVQFPLPAHLDEDAVIEAIRADKDVDGFHPESIGRLVVGKETFVSCTPAGVMVLLEESGVDLNGKDVVVIGRSNNVGKPVGLLALAQNATVTFCHSRTTDLPDHVRAADVVIVAVGRPEMVKGDWIKEGAVVIDVGINRLEDGRLVGDVEFETARQRASAITPVPGGVGPMTIAMLLENTLTATVRQNERKQGGLR